MSDPITFVSCLAVALLLAMGCDTVDQKERSKTQRIAAVPVKPTAQPEFIHLSFEDDPGFKVPLNVMEKFESFNQLLPAKLRSASTWASLKLTMSDGSIEVVELPATQFGEAGYDLRGADPGMKLVVFDKESQSIRASFGPLGSIHVAPIKAANFEPAPLPIVVDGKTLAVDSKKLALLKTVIEPRKGRNAWTLIMVIKTVEPTCVIGSLKIENEEESFAVLPVEVDKAYLRFNRRGNWMFSLGAVGGVREGKRVRGVTQMNVVCVGK